MDTKALKQKILDLAIRGKLVPQDPNDEPASVLLEKIRAEKQQMVKDGMLKSKDLKNDTVIFVGEDNLHYEKFSDGSIKCIEKELPFTEPKGWSWTRLGNVGCYKKGPFGSSITKAMFVPESDKAIKVYEQKNAINKDATIGKYYISEEKFESLKSFEVFPNDIIVSCAGTIGETFVLPQNMRKGIINQALMKISLYDITMLDFYLIYFDLRLKVTAQEQGHGSALKNIPPFDKLKKYLIPIPPAREQERIVNTVKRYTNIISEINHNKTDISILLEKTKSKILDLAIRGKLVPQDPKDEPAKVLLERIRKEKEDLIKTGKLKRDKRESIIFRGDDNSYYETIGSKTVNIKDELPYNIPSTWTWVRLGTIGNWGAGATPNRAHSEYYGGGIPWLKTGDLNDDYITEIPETITELALKETSVKLNPVGSILIAMYGATIGKLGILTKPATTNQACCACCPVEGVYNKYLFYFLMSHKSKFINCGIGGAQPNISKEKIVATLMPLPPINEQKAIVARIEKLGFLLNSINADIA